MTSLISSNGVRRYSLLANLRTLIQAAAVLFLLYVMVRIGVGLINQSFAHSISVTWTSVAALIFYLGAHMFRTLRLGMLIGGWQVGLRTIFYIHFLTAAVSAALPLKVGDVYRVVELSAVAGGTVRSILIVWWERVFDICVILAILIFAFSTTPVSAHAPYYAITGAAVVFILGTAVVFFVAPDNFRRLSLLIIRRHDSPRSIGVLRALNATHQAIKGAPAIVKNKLPSLITLTALIWMFEVICFALLLSAGTRTFGAATESLMGFLSTVAVGDTLFSVLNTKNGAAFLYVVATQIPLVLIGLVAGAIYFFDQTKRGSQ